MSGRMAVKIAIDLFHVPSLVRLIQSEPLPDGVPLLLRIAAGEEEAAQAAVKTLRRSQEVVRRAAIFFIEEILFAPQADSYRVLGVKPDASAVELRQNMGLLLKWLHPDKDPHDRQAIFVGKVTAAWNDLKTEERRAAYDEAQRQSAAAASKVRTRPDRTLMRPKRSARPPLGPLHYAGRHDLRMQTAYRYKRVGLFRRALAVLFHRPIL